MVDNKWEKVQGELKIESENLLWFNIKPEYKSIYYTIMVFKNKKEMIKAGIKIQKWLKLDNIKRKFEAIFIPVKLRDTEKKRTKPQDGFILFNRKTLNSYMVSHEMYHATTSLFVRKNIEYDIDNEDHEEMGADIQGTLTEQFWNTWNEEDKDT